MPWVVLVCIRYWRDSCWDLRIHHLPSGVACSTGIFVQVIRVGVSMPAAVHRCGISSFMLLDVKGYDVW
jgi:hypothetical protein